MTGLMCELLTSGLSLKEPANRHYRQLFGCYKYQGLDIGFCLRTCLFELNQQVYSVLDNSSGSSVGIMLEMTIFRIISFKL